MSEPNRKVAVISTSVARTVTKEGVVPSALLLALKEQGFTVIIVTTRANLDDEDKSWSHLADHIFHPNGTAEDLRMCGANSDEMMDPYREMFRQFGYIEPIAPKNFWCYKDALRNQGVIDSTYGLRKWVENHRR